MTSVQGKRKVITTHCADDDEAKRPKSVPRPTKKAAPNVDDSDGYLVVKNGVFIFDRYKVLEFVGKGTFARVYHCFDTALKKNVAVKIVRNIPKYREAALAEIQTLERVKESDPLDQNHCLRLISSFEHKNHICMAFDKFGLSLFDFLRSNRFRGFAMSHIKVFARQLLHATKFLHDMSIIHTDIKVENILLVNSAFTLLALDSTSFVKIPSHLDIRLIDFGSAILTPHSHQNLVSTRHYRAPEIVLGERYSFAIDLWSIGCILFELYTGRLLFDTHCDDEHLKLIERAVGPFPASVRRAAPHFRDDGVLTWEARAASKESRERIARCVPIEEVIGPTEPLFVDLIKRLLAIDPLERITASAALEHDWLQA